MNPKRHVLFAKKVFARLGVELGGWGGGHTQHPSEGTPYTKHLSHCVLAGSIHRLHIAKISKNGLNF